MMSVQVAGIPVASMFSNHVASVLSSLEVLPPSAVLPMMAVAILCVWVAHCSPVHESAPEPAQVHESTAEPTQALEHSPVLAPTCEFLAFPVLTKVVTSKPSANPVMAKETVSELTVFHITAKEAIPEPTACPAMAKEAIPEPTACSVMAMEAVSEHSACHVMAIEAGHELSACHAAATEAIHELSAFHIKYVNKYVNLACFLNICKHIMVFLCFSRVKILQTAPLMFSSHT